MSTRASSEDDSTAKRRKIFRACTQCVHAKTRCEDVSASGCGLCRRRRKACSLAGAVGRERDSPVDSEPRRSRAPTYSRGEGDAAGRTYWQDVPPVPVSSHPTTSDSQLERRLQALEDQLSHRTPAITPTLTHRSSEIPRPDTAPGVIDAMEAIAPLAEMRYCPTLPYGDGLFTLLPPTNPYPCVIKRGILTSDQVDMAFHSFKHHVAPILPLSPWLASSTPTPRHPFIVLAFLHHSPMFMSAVLADMVEESLLVLLRGGASEDAVMALLILSLAPPIATEPEGSRMVRQTTSAMRLISLAWEGGKVLAMGVTAERTARAGKNLGEPIWQDALARMEVWCAVVNRYNSLQTHGGYPDNLASWAPYELGPSALHANVECHRFLHAQRALNEQALVVLTAVTELDKEMLDDAKADTLMQRWEGGMADLEAMRFESPTLTLDQLCMRQSLLRRITTYMVALPSPLSRLRQIAVRPVHAVIPCCVEVLAQLIPDPADPPARFVHPSQVAQTGMTACMMLLGAVAVTLVLHPDFPVERVDPARLKALVRVLKRSNGMTHAILVKTEEIYGSAEDIDRPRPLPLGQGTHPSVEGAMDTTSGVATAGAGAVAGAGAMLGTGSMLASGMDPLASLFDVDFGGWDFLLPEWAPGEHQQQSHGGGGGGLWNATPH